MLQECLTEDGTRSFGSTDVHHQPDVHHLDRTDSVDGPSDDTCNVFYDINSLPVEDQEDWERRMIYRVFLRSPYPAAIWLIDTWYTVHLGLINEMSLFPQNALKRGIEFRCSCEIMSVSDPDVRLDLHVEIRAIDDSEREWSGNRGLTWPGLSGGKGALSVKINPRSTGAIPSAFLLKIGIPRGKNEDSLHVMPLLIGPFKLVSNSAEAQLTGEELLYFHRQLPLSPSVDVVEEGKTRSVTIRESPEIAIPGKIWDSALFAAPCALQTLISMPTRSPHILDLSSGTGVCGLWMAAEISKHNYKDGLVTITDLHEAVPGMSLNIELNQHLISPEITIDVKVLKWGELDILSEIAPIDVLIACDLIYEAHLLPPLVATLDALTTPGRTNIIVGYKQRGLSKIEKQLLWRTFEKKFRVERLDGIDAAMEKACHSPFMGVELWRMWKPA